MLKKYMRQVITACMLAGLVLSSVTVWAPTALRAAPVAQVLEAQEVGGTLTGGEFAKIWLELSPTNPGQEVIITSSWDRANPAGNGVGFYVLDEAGLREVLNSGTDVRDANLATASPMAESPDNVLGTVVQAGSGTYTIVLFNDSETDANFTLTAENGVMSDDSDQVRDLNAAPTSASDDGEEGEGEEAGEGDAAAEGSAETEASAEVTSTEETTATAEATPAPVADETEAETTTTEETDTEETDTEETEADAEAEGDMAEEDSAMMASDGVVEAQELRGELPNQNDQHYLSLEPSERDGNIVLTLSFDPQDSSELARRLNFWVLDQTGFDRYVNPNSNVILSQIALAAGSSASELAANERQAQFSASGLGPYVVIVYNNSEVPGSYTLRADGATLVDDSGQTLTAQEASTGAIGATAEGSETVTATTTTTDTTDTGGTADAADSGTATQTTTTTREGTPGESYTIQSGDTLSLIARDIYGDIDLWEGICSFNELANCNTIEVDQVLQLPTQAQIDSGESAPAASTTAETTADATAETETESASATATATETETVTGTAGAGDDAGEADVESGASVTSTTTTTETTGTGDAGGSAEGDGADILTTLEAEGSFNTLVQALEAAALTDSLQTAGPFTLVAPTDAAFADLPETAMNQLLANPTGQLTEILLFHVLSGEVASSDITNEMEATTQQGQSVTFEVADGAIRVNGANITASDIQASNGVVHAIDAVLLPPSAE